MPVFLREVAHPGNTMRRGRSPAAAAVLSPVRVLKRLEGSGAKEAFALRIGQALRIEKRVESETIDHCTHLGSELSPLFD